MRLTLTLAIFIAATAPAQAATKSQIQLAQQTAAMSYGSSARVVGSTIYVPTTTRFDNKAPTTTAAQQKIINDSLSRGHSMAKAQSLAKNGPSFTSLNPTGKVAVVAKAPVCTTGQSFDQKTRKMVTFTQCR